MLADQLHDSKIRRIFDGHYREGVTAFAFNRRELAAAAKEVGLDNPKDLDAIVLAFRYRRPLPGQILATAPPGLAWIIESRGRAWYRFRLALENRILPRWNLVVT